MKENTTKKSGGFRELVAPLTIKQYWISSVLFSFILMLFFWNGVQSFKDFLIGFVWIYIIYFTQSIGHSFIGNQLQKHFPWDQSPIKRGVLTLISMVIYSVIGFAIVSFIISILLLDKNIEKSWEIAKNGLTTAIFISFIFALVFSAISFFLQLQKSKTKQEKLEKELANYRYDILKRQVNPHFLFNSLNVLTDLVHVDADLSEKFIQQLSKIYRYILDNTEKRMVLLTDEVAFLRSYIFLLNIRFEGKLKIEMDLKHDDPNAYIVPVSLQSLVENAIKHNEVTKANPLMIYISKSENHIIVSNKIRLKKSNQDLSRTGLNSLKKQFTPLTNLIVTATVVEGNFVAKIPIIIKKQTNLS